MYFYRKFISLPVDFSRVKIALAQLHVRPGYYKDTLLAMERMVNEAGESGAHVIAFPEMAFGYFYGDDWQQNAHCLRLMRLNERLQSLSENGMGIIWGNIFLDSEINQRVGHPNGIHPNMDSRTRKYNAAYAYQNGLPMSRMWEPRTGDTDLLVLPPGVTIKTLLPNYRFFDDKRYFFSMLDLSLDFNIPLEKLLQPFLLQIDGKYFPLGVLLCEDMWCKDYRINGEAINVSRYLVANGAQALINISSSPWTFGKNSARDRVIQFLFQDIAAHNLPQVPFAYVNGVGPQNNGKNIITADGASNFYSSSGALAAYSRRFHDEDLLVRTVGQIQESPPLARDESYAFNRLHELTGSQVSLGAEDMEAAQIVVALLEGLKYFKDMSGMADHPNTVIGLSGGIDSAVVLWLCRYAFGREKLFTVGLPTQFNTEETQVASKKIAENAGVRYQVQPIQPIFEQLGDMVNHIDLAGDGRKLSPSPDEENLQAMVRNLILSNLARKYGGIYTCNGNKVELAAGYYTLDADGRGAIAPIADLTKEQTWMVARLINKLEAKEVIPTELIPDIHCRFEKGQIEPTAGLKDDQTDPFIWLFHDRLVAKMMQFNAASPSDFLQWYLDGTLSQNLGIPNAILEEKGVSDPEGFIRAMDFIIPLQQQMRFKRVLSVPNIAISQTAYGYDRRESLYPFSYDEVYLELREQILALKP